MGMFKFIGFLMSCSVHIFTFGHRVVHMYMHTCFSTEVERGIVHICRWVARGSLSPSIAPKIGTSYPACHKT